MADFVVGSLVTRMKMDANEYLREKARAEKSTERMIAALEHEQRVLKMGEAAARQYALSQAGVSQAKIQQVNALNASVAALRAENAAKTGGGGGNNDVLGLGSMFGRGSAVGNIGTLLRGGGALIGANLLAQAFSRTAAKAVEIRDNEAALHSDMLAALPVLGKWYEGWKDIGELIWSGAAGMKKIEEQQAAQADFQKFSDKFGTTDAEQKAEAILAEIAAKQTEAAKTGNSAQLGRLAEIQREVLQDREDAAKQPIYEEMLAAQKQLAEEAKTAKAEAKELDDLMFQDEQERASWRRKEMDKETKEINDRNAKRRADQQKKIQEVEVEGPRKFREAVHKYQGIMSSEEAAPLAGGLDANSAEAMNRVSMHGLNREADSDIQRAILEVAKREAEDTRALKDAILDYMNDPSKGFVI